MFLSQKFCLQVVLVPLPSQATSREIYGACLLCVCLSSLDLGQLFLELDLVISLTSTGISPQDVKADALARLVHLSAKRRGSPRAQSANVCEGWKSQYFGIFGRWNWCSICGMMFCLLPKNVWVSHGKGGLSLEYLLMWVHFGQAPGSHGVSL